MAYDQGLAERVRTLLEEHPDFHEKQMFGGLCFLLSGKMCCGVVKDELMVRVGAARHAEALKQPHARPMDFTGTPLNGFIFVSPDGVEADVDLEFWVTQGVAVARAVAVLPPKPVKRARPTAKRAKPAKSNTKRKAKR
ncbi:MAG: TfoX/Sxy family protein [Myxococcaceae bacterium]|nr:TfoX/Sxy family protein [Myxococcaceae bacterium]